MAKRNAVYYTLQRAFEYRAKENKAYKRLQYFRHTVCVIRKDPTTSERALQSESDELSDSEERSDGKFPLLRDLPGVNL